MLFTADLEGIIAIQICKGTITCSFLQDTDTNQHFSFSIDDLSGNRVFLANLLLVGLLCIFI